MNDNVPHAKLGEHSYAIYAQKVGYLENRLKRWTGKLADAASQTQETSSIVALLGDHAYDVLSIFIPRIMPEHEFRGFASADAMQAYSDGDDSAYEPDKDGSPSVPEIVEAFKLVMQVNRFDLFGHLGKLVGDEMRQALVALILTKMTEGSTGTSSPTASSTTTPAMT
jgi:hypothetical protein